MLLCALLAALSFSFASRGEVAGPALGLQSYTCRHMDFDHLVDFAVQHHLEYIEMNSKHMDPTSPKEELLRKKAILEKHGLVCYTFGVNHRTSDPAQNRRLFETAKMLGMKLLLVEPGKQSDWDNLEALVKEFDIKLAIHNHGIKSPYGKPEAVKKVLATRDPRIGVCLDVGHLTGAGFNAAKTMREYEGRVYDIHLKDKKVETIDGKETISDVMLGSGDTDFDAFFAEVKRQKYDQVMAIETDDEDFAKAPEAYVTHSVEFYKAHVK